MLKNLFLAAMLTIGSAALFAAQGPALMISGSGRLSADAPFPAPRAPYLQGNRAMRKRRSRRPVRKAPTLPTTPTAAP